MISAHRDSKSQRLTLPSPTIYHLLIIAFYLLITAVLSACASRPHGDPVPAVERYLQAKVTSDAKTVRLLLCSTMESQWQSEAYAFDDLSQVRLEGLTCQRLANSEIVDCRGTIIATYAGEQTEFPLSAYRVVWEGGEWKWCGEDTSSSGN